MGHRFTEGRAWLSQCENPRCEAPIIEAHVSGLTLKLDTKAVPLRDAIVLERYNQIVINIWKGPSQLWATGWFRDLGKVDRGHLYIQHVHGKHKGVL